METQEIKAIVSKSFFSYECTVQARIEAPPDRVWALLTDAMGYSKWNSLIIGIEGVIAPNQEIKVKTTLDPTRSVELKVSEFDPSTRLVWSDGWLPFYRGERRSVLKGVSGGFTDYTYTQAARGLLLPMVYGSMPDFATAFEKMVSELKAAAEQLK